MFSTRLIFFGVLVTLLASGYGYFKYTMYEQQQKVNKLKDKLVIQKVKSNNLRTIIQEMNITTNNKLFEEVQKQKKKDIQDEVKPYKTNEDISDTVGGWHKFII